MSSGHCESSRLSRSRRSGLASLASFERDAMTAVGILCVGYGIGYGAAVINPFTVLIAQSIAGVEQGSGMGFRLVLMVVLLAIGFRHVWRYASRVKADPSTSLVADIEPPAEAPKEALELDSTPATTTASRRFPDGRDARGRPRSRCRRRWASRRASGGRGPSRGPAS